MWAVVPVKDFASAKQRLAGALSEAARQQLAQAMVCDVLAVLTRHPSLQRVVLVAQQGAMDWLQEQALPETVELLPEAELGAIGLNTVLMAALGRLAERGIDEVLLMHGDLPLVTSADLDHLLGAHARRPPGGQVGVTNRCGTGTNALVLQLPQRWPLSFGADSWRRHGRAAAEAGLSLAPVEAPGLQFDIDLAEDVNDLRRLSRPGQRAAHSLALLHTLSSQDVFGS